MKPQFEAGREAVGKGGIVRDAAVREAQRRAHPCVARSAAGLAKRWANACRPFRADPATRSIWLGRGSMAEVADIDIEIERLGSQGDGVAQRDGELRSMCRSDCRVSAGI